MSAEPQASRQRSITHGVVLAVLGLAIAWIGGQAGQITERLVAGMVLVAGGLTLAAGPALFGRSSGRRLLAGISAVVGLALAIAATYVMIGPIAMAVLGVIALAVSAVASLSARTGSARP